MPIVVGIRFKQSSKTYYFDPCELELHRGDTVIVDTVRGPDMARVAFEAHTIQDSELVDELKPVLRLANESDFHQMNVLAQQHDDVLKRCAERVVAHGLPMQLVKAEYSFDGSRLTFYFTAEHRVDFRQLVRDLARTFRSRIELRQIGPRDEAKLLGGIGPCGQMLCCERFLPDFARVSIKMAKEQDLPLNPGKISGVCGRLLCCLSYEHQHYLELRAELPRRGHHVHTPDGPGEVVSVNVLKQLVLVRLQSSGMEEHYPIDQLGRTMIEDETDDDRYLVESDSPILDQFDADEQDVDILALLDDDASDGVESRKHRHRPSSSLVGSSHYHSNMVAEERADRSSIPATPSSSVENNKSAPSDLDLGRKKSSRRRSRRRSDTDEQTK